MAKQILTIITYQEVDIDNATAEELEEIENAVWNQDTMALQNLSFYKSDFYKLETDPNGENILEAWIQGGDDDLNRD